MSDGVDDGIHKKNTNVPAFNPKNVGVWEYRDLDNNLIAYVEKLPAGAAGEKKQYYPWTLQQGVWVRNWLRNPTGKTVIRPLYGLQKLTQNPSLPVLLVEGEKAADVGATLFEHYTVLAWMGGTSVVPDKVDLSPLYGRNVTLWPDNDVAGFKAMDSIAKHLIKQHCTVHVVDYEQLLEFPDKWDFGKITLSDGLADIALVQQLNTILDSALLVTLTANDIDETKFPYLSSKGNPINIVDNIRYLLAHTSKTFRYNEMTDDLEINDPTKNYSIPNSYNCHVNDIAGLCVIHNVPKVDLHAHLDYIGEQNRYHPVVEWVNSKPWDKIDRLNSADGFLSTISAENQDMASRLLFRWMCGAIAAAFTPTGMALPGVLVLQGAQGIGKTSFVKRLVSVGCEKFIKTGLILDPTQKDSIMNCLSCWIGELGEVGATFKSDNSKLKAFFTDSSDHIRRPYDRKLFHRPRRTAFIATVNELDFLRDPTGNRRFWVIKANHINYEHTLDMQQVWAQIKWYWDKNPTAFIPVAEEMAYIQSNNEEFLPLEPLEEQIRNAFDWDCKPWTQAYTPSEILIALGYDLKMAGAKMHLNNCGRILRKLVGDKSGKSRKGYYWLLPRMLPQKFNSFLCPPDIPNT